MIVELMEQLAELNAIYDRILAIDLSVEVKAERLAIEIDAYDPVDGITYI